MPFMVDERTEMRLEAVSVGAQALNNCTAVFIPVHDRLQNT